MHADSALSSARAHCKCGFYLWSVVWQEGECCCSITFLLKEARGTTGVLMRVEGISETEEQYCVAKRAAIFTARPIGQAVVGIGIETKRVTNVKICHCTLYSQKLKV